MDVNEGENGAVDALRRYRAREGDAAACLIGRASALERQAPQERRRTELLDRAERDGIGRDFAERIYDIASDVGLEPAFAYELIRCGVGVQPLDTRVYGAAGPSGEELTAEAPPGELLDPGSRQPDAREQRMHASFRRLRRHLEAEPDAEAALRAFTAEPDVGRLDY
jgi:hypothetical protein